MSEQETFEDLVEWATQYIHVGLLEGGGREMKKAIYVALNRAIEWYKKEDEG